MAEKTPPKQKRLTPSEWMQAQVLWEMGQVTLDDLARIYGVSREAFRKGLNQRGSKKGSRAHEVGEAAMDAAKAEQQKLFEKIGEIKERYLGYSDAIAKMTMEELLKARRDKIPFGQKKDDFQSLQRASGIIAKMRDEHYHLLGLYREGALEEELPDIAVTEYTAEELEQIQKDFEELEDEMKGGDDPATEEELSTDIELPFGEEDGDD